jgi:hypothetical protein
MRKAKTADVGLDVDDLTRDLESAKAAQEKRFTQIVRYVRRERARPATSNAEHMLPDIRLCALLAEYEKSSEIVGMIDFLLDLKARAKSQFPTDGAG